MGGGSIPATGFHAIVWTGTAAICVDLNPAGFSYSAATGVDGIYQVGYGSGTGTDNNDHALIWTGTAASCQDLHGNLPAGYSSSEANAVDVNADGKIWVVGSADDSSGNEYAVMWHYGPAPWAMSNKAAARGGPCVGNLAKVWGQVGNINASTFTLDDGSRSPITVNYSNADPSLTMPVSGNYASVTGTVASPGNISMSPTVDALSIYK